MRSTALFASLAAFALGACESQPPQPQQTNLINATSSDPAAPSAADGNDIITGQQQAPPPQ